MRGTRVRARTAMLLVGLLLAPTGGAALARASTAYHAEPAVASTATSKVKIIDFAFSPKAVTIAKGTRVRWTNRGAVRHTTTSNAGLWDSGLIAPSDSYSRTFKKAGTFRYHCTIHPTRMKGKIIVK